MHLQLGAYGRGGKHAIAFGRGRLSDGVPLSLAETVGSEPAGRAHAALRGNAAASLKPLRATGRMQTRLRASGRRMSMTSRVFLLNRPRLGPCRLSTASRRSLSRALTTVATPGLAIDLSSLSVFGSGRFDCERAVPDPFRLEAAGVELQPQRRLRRFSRSCSSQSVCACNQHEVR